MKLISIQELASTYYRILLINLRGLFKIMFGHFFYKKFRLWNITKEFEKKVNLLYEDPEDYKY